MRRITLASLALLCSIASAPAYSSECSDVLRDGTFDITKDNTATARVAVFVDYLLRDRKFVDFMQNNNRGGGSLSIPDYLNVNGSGSKSEERRKEFSDLLVSYTNNTESSVQQLDVYAKRASTAITDAWLKCMKSTGLWISHTVTKKYTIVNLVYDSGADDGGRARITRFTARGGISNCNAEPPFTVGRGGFLVTCDRSEAEGIIALSADRKIENMQGGGLFVIPEKTPIENVVCLKPSCGTPPPRYDTLYSGDEVVVRFTLDGNWYLMNAGPGDLITTNVRTDGQLQDSLSFHTLQIIKKSGSPIDPAINAGDVVYFRGTTSGNRVLTLSGGRLRAANSEGDAAATLFRIISQKQKSIARIESGDYIYLQEITGGGYLTHNPNDERPELPDFAAGTPGGFQSMFIRRPRG